MKIHEHVIIYLPCEPSTTIFASIAFILFRLESNNAHSFENCKQKIKCLTQFYSIISIWSYLCARVSRIVYLCFNPIRVSECCLLSNLLSFFSVRSLHLYSALIPLFFMENVLWKFSHFLYSKSEIVFFFRFIPNNKYKTT